MCAAVALDHELFARPFWLKTTDYHTAGEPFRIVPSSSLPPGFLPSTPAPSTLSGSASSPSSSATPSSATPPPWSHPSSPCSVYAHRQSASSSPSHPLNLLRRTLVSEPRGHADMYGCFVLPPSLLAPSAASPGEEPTLPDFGVLFWHKDGFSLACGHGTIALGKWAVDEGVVPLDRARRRTGGREGKDGEREEMEVEVDIEVPSGRVKAVVHLIKDGKAGEVEFVNVPSRALARGLSVPMSNSNLEGEAGREIKADMSFGGAVYASLNVNEVGGLQVIGENAGRFIALGREVKRHLGGKEGKWQGHELYGTIFYEEMPSNTLGHIHQRNITIFADGAIDRSPCGSGTCARVALLHAEGKMRAPRPHSEEAESGTGEKGTILKHGSVVGTLFEASIDAETEEGVVVRVRGEANLVGRCEWLIDSRDPVWPGFVFR